VIIEYDGTVTESLKKVIRPKINAVSHLFPIWCDKLVVYWDAKDKDASIFATCDPRHEYRTMAVTIYPLFLQTDDWQNVLLHEIQHGIIRPYVAKVERLVEKLVKDEVVAEYLNEELAEAEEAVCEDLAILARKLMEPIDNKNVG